MIRDERGWPWVTIRQAAVEFVLFVTAAGLFVALCAVSPS